MAGAEEDDRLVAQAGQGDASAFRHLVDRHARRVLALARSVIGSQEDAEEVTQEVFLTVWKQAGSWQPGRARFSTWLHRVTLNQSLNHRQRVVSRDEPLDHAPEPEDPSPAPDEAMAYSQRRARITGAMAALPENQRTAIMLSVASGLSNGEVAAVMGLSVKAVEALLVRARRRLREVAKQE